MFGLVVGYVEGYCSPDDGLGQMNVSLSSIVLLGRHFVQAIGLCWFYKLLYFEVCRGSSFERC